MATFYFNGVVGGNWNTLSNWWQDSGFSIPATSLPTIVDDVIAYGGVGTNLFTVANLTINNYSESALVLLGISFTVTDTITFNGYVVVGFGSLLNGNFICNNVSNLEDTIISGNATFNDNSSCYTSTVVGNATFNDDSYALESSISGNAIFNGARSNGDAKSVSTTIGGNATFLNGAYLENPTSNPNIVAGTMYFDIASMKSQMVLGFLTGGGGGGGIGPDAWTVAAILPPPGINGSSLLGAA